jgi:hypothetical protein
MPVINIMAYVNVDIDMDEFDSYELIEELENRSLCLTDSDKQKLLDIISYADSDKWKWFLSIKDKYSLMELESKIDEAERISVSKEQLSLQL